MTSKSRDLAVWWAVALLGVAPIAQAAEVRGTVRLEGAAPAPATITIEPKTGPHSTEGCGSLVKGSQQLVVDPQGGVQSAAVWVEGAPEASTGSVILTQRDCVFTPHLVAIPAGASVAIRNADRVLHNVRIFREGQPASLMHRWQKGDAADLVWRFRDEGRYIVRCGVHPWMYGWVVVTPPAASAVTDAEGRFVLAGVSAGAHILHVWHETLGTREVAIQVGTDGAELGPITFRQDVPPVQGGGGRHQPVPPDR